MSALDQALIDDARALLAAFARNDLRQLRTKLRDDVELVLARELPAPSGTAVLAPHVATLAECAQEGQSIAAGDTIAVIEVLGERSDVKAPTGGTIAGALEPGTLVQYGEALAWVEEADPS